MPQEENCVICQEAITNPVCPDCLQREIEHWLVDVNPSLVSNLRDYTGIFDAYTQKGVDCVICGRDMRVCAHCFCKDIYQLFRDKLGQKADDFLFSFNFELNQETG